MTRSILFIIRHAEKPESNSGPPAYDENGREDPRCLTIRGWQRAGAWAVLFGSGAKPDVIYAANSDRGPEGKKPSRRAFLTVLPLAERLGQSVRTDWAQGEEARLVEEIAAAEGVVLVCWEHKRITEALLPQLFKGNIPADAPRIWDSARYDPILRLERDAESWTFRQILPCLLAGDPTTPM